MATVQQRSTATTSTNGDGGIRVENPATGEVIGTVPNRSADEVAEIVARARAAQPVLEPRPPTRHDDRLSLVFEARRTQPPIYGVVRFRMRGEGDFSEAPLTGRGAVVSADVRPPRGGVLEYYADALGTSGALRAGSAERPIELPVPDVVPDSAPGRRPSHPRRPPSKLLWLAIPAGAVLGTALGLGLYFGLRARD